MVTIVAPYKITINRTSDIFTLPDRIAIEKGFFKKRGLDVQVALGADSVTFPNAEPLTNPLDGAFEKGASDIAQLCEWGAIDRVERGKRAGQIAYLRPAITMQAILTWDENIEEPHDLVNVPVDVNGKFYGGHYTALQMLEGTLRRDQIKLAFSGRKFAEWLPAGPKEKLTICVPEPWISVSLKLGARLVCITGYRGSGIFADHVPQNVRHAYVEAINEAADLLTAERPKYNSYLTDLTSGMLEPHELSPLFFRWTHAKPITRERFDESYKWMQSWEMAGGGTSYEKAVRDAVMAA